MAVEAMGNTIRVPQGDTGVVKFVPEESEIGADDRALFTIASRNGAAILRKVIAPQENGEFHLPFVYEDTARMKPDTYEWSLRVVRNGMFDANGKIVSVDAVHTPVMLGKMTVLPVAGGAR